MDTTPSDGLTPTAQQEFTEHNSSTNRRGFSTTARRRLLVLALFLLGVAPITRFAYLAGYADAERPFACTVQGVGDCPKECRCTWFRGVLVSRSCWTVPAMEQESIL